MSRARSVVLSGFMATGKSTVGRIVARTLGVPFVDTDEVIAEQAGTTTGELFAKEGEARFRDREAEVVLPLLADGVRRVIAFGGGTVTIPAVRHAALEAATVVTLTARPETIVARVASLAARPNLGSRSPLDRTKDLLALRREAYGECHASIATDDLDADSIAARVADLESRDLLAMPLGTRSYAIEIADGEPDRLAAAIDDLAPSSVLVVTDTNVEAARGAWLRAACARASRTIAIAPGERSKNLATVSRIWDEALAAGVDRKALVVAFGGGVVGDLAGFAASTLLRGLRCVQVPTTLLSMVDSSVGGKTGFDHAAGKNLLGAFFQPSRVLVDLEHLTTLDAREKACGLAEIVKIALVRDAALLAVLERETAAIARGDRDVLRDVVRRAVLAKIRVVREDELDTGLRSLLNLGHTVGHALEALAQYTDLLHGEAVAVGTVVEIAALERLGLSPKGTAERARALLSAFALPTDAARDRLEAAWPFVLSDKKRAASTLSVPVVREAGVGYVAPIAVADLRRAILG